MTDWHVILGSERSSASIETLQEWIRSKKLTRAHLVCKSGDKAWRTAGEVPELAVVFVEQEKAATLPELLDVLGCLFWVFAIGVAVWAGYSFFYAPTRKAAPVDESRKRTTAPPINALHQEVQTQFGAISPRIEMLKAGNVDVFITRDEFQSVPYPDRDQAVSAVGKTWCGGVDQTFMPSVKIRDVTTGRELGAYSCVLGRATVRQ